MRKFLILSLVLVGFITCAQNENPSFEEIISLPSVGGVKVSPDGSHFTFQKEYTDWENNRFFNEIWLSKNGGEPFQLTNSEGKGSSNPKWSPDGKWIAFTSGRNEKNQIYVIRISGGEAFQLTNEENSIGQFAWSPDGKKIAFLRSDPEDESEKTRKEKFGEYAVEDAEYKLNRLYAIDFDPDQLHPYPLPEQLEDSAYQARKKGRLLMDSVDYTVTQFKWSPDGRKMALSHQPNPLINSFFDSDISILDIKSKEINQLVSNESFDGVYDWSPDSKSIVYATSLDDTTSNYYKNGFIYRIDIDGSNNKRLAGDFNEDIGGITWTENGLLAVAWQKTERKMLRIDENTGDTDIIPSKVDLIWGYDISNDGKTIAFTGRMHNEMTEVYITDQKFKSVKKLTQITNRINDWAVAQSEVISWKSKDGAAIEGVLHKPEDYDPAKKYPLLVIIHGGPTGISTPNPVPAYVYPMVQWLNKGALILRPNYRGSAGYGEDFRSLNVKNLGVGDAWDVISGIDHLSGKGMVDTTKLGAMGWSQGGYISAFLTTSSNIFKAISVGAGISNWMTYYVNTDIHPFTRQYLKATPWEDEEIYDKTSPMTYINNASTPTLIQHGEFDRRVPPANAYELYQGLQDVGVESKLIIYKGFGHGISKPKEQLAAMWHNWIWFGKYLWEEDIEMPVNDEE